MQAVNGVRVGAFVESGFFQRGADQNSPVAARHKVNLRSTDHVAHNVMPGAGYREHLSLDRAGREAMGGEAPGPRAGTIHDARGAVMGSIRTDAARPAHRTKAGRSR